MKKELSLKYGIITAIIGLAMMLLGVYRGETIDVMAKAVKVCLECIGIG